MPTLVGSTIWSSFAGRLSSFPVRRVSFDLAITSPTDPFSNLFLLPRNRPPHTGGDRQEFRRRSRRKSNRRNGRREGPTRARHCRALGQLGGRRRHPQGDGSHLHHARFGPKRIRAGKRGQDETQSFTDKSRGFFRWKIKSFALRRA